MTCCPLQQDYNKSKYWSLGLNEQLMKAFYRDIKYRMQGIQTKICFVIIFIKLLEIGEQNVLQQ